MTPLRLSVTVLGRPLLVVDLGTQPAPAAAEPAKSQPEGEAPGPVTEHRLGAATQIGFTSSRPRWASTWPLGDDGGEP